MVYMECDLFPAQQLLEKPLLRGVISAEFPLEIVAVLSGIPNRRRAFAVEVRLHTLAHLTIRCVVLLDILVLLAQRFIDSAREVAKEIG